MIKLLEKLFCKHEYEYFDQYKANGGMEKIIRRKCKKCGRIKAEII